MVSWAFSANFPSRGAPYSCPFRLSFYSQQVSPPWVHAPNPTFQHPAPLCNRRHTTQPGVRRVVAQTMHSSYFVLLSTDHQLHSPLIPRRSLSIPADFPTVRECFWVWRPPLTFSFPQGLLVPFLIPLFLFFFFLSLILPSGEGIFPIFLGVWSLSLMFSRCSLRIVPFVDVFLMYLWGETNSTSSYSSILTTPPQLTF